MASFAWEAANEAILTGHNLRMQEDLRELVLFMQWQEKKELWRAAPLCSWTIWSERNGRAFENVEISIHKLKVSMFIRYLGSLSFFFFLEYRVVPGSIESFWGFYNSFDLM